MKTTQPLRPLLPLLALAASLQLTLGYYDPAAQRWINRDPIGERGAKNLHAFADSRPTQAVDSFGLVVEMWDFKPCPKTADGLPCIGFSLQPDSASGQMKLACIYTGTSYGNLRGIGPISTPLGLLQQKDEYWFDWGNGCGVCVGVYQQRVLIQEMQQWDSINRTRTILWFGIVSSPEPPGYGLGPPVARDPWFPGDSKRSEVIGPGGTGPVGPPVDTVRDWEAQNSKSQTECGQGWPSGSGR